MASKAAIAKINPIEASKIKTGNLPTTNQMLPIKANEKCTIEYFSGCK